jgi:hypothetical protein
MAHIPRMTVSTMNQSRNSLRRIGLGSAPTEAVRLSIAALEWRSSYLAIWQIVDILRLHSSQNCSSWQDQSITQSGALQVFSRVLFASLTV